MKQYEVFQIDNEGNKIKFFGRHWLDKNHRYLGALGYTLLSLRDQHGFNFVFNEVKIFPVK